MAKTKILIFSAVVGIIYVGYDLLKPQYQGEGFGQIAVGLQYVFIGVVVIPLVFGILGFILSKERRILQALSFLGISFAVMLVLMLAAGAWKNMENKKAYPKTEVNSLSPYSPERKGQVPVQ